MDPIQTIGLVTSDLISQCLLDLSWINVRANDLPDKKQSAGNLNMMISNAEFFKQRV